MNEWAMALWAMTASHHQWPMPTAQDPPAVVRAVGAPALAPAKSAQATPPSAILPEERREELRQALERMAPLLTGRLVWDPVARLYVPELIGQDENPPPRQ